MASFVQLTDENGDTVNVNPSRVQYFYQSELNDRQLTCVIVDGLELYVRQSAVEVHRLLSQPDGRETK